MVKSTSWVAIVDDEPMVRRVIMRVLRLATIPAREFSSGAGFLTELDTQVPDCVLLDIVLPGLDGFEICAQIRQRAPDLPVILMSGNIIPTEQFSASPGVGINFLEKPIHSATLLSAVWAALDRNQIVQNCSPDSITTQVKFSTGIT